MSGEVRPKDSQKTQGRSSGNLFLVALPACMLVALLGLLYPEAFAQVAGDILSTAFRALDWFFLGLVTALLILSLWLALSRFGQLKLGSPEDQREFSIPSWLAMLFAAGMGVGLLFWGVAEPLTHLTGAPGYKPGSAAAARHSIVVAIFHWGLHAWAVYGVAALVLAYFGFRHDTPYLPGGRSNPAIDRATRGLITGGRSLSFSLRTFQLERIPPNLSHWPPRLSRC